MKTFKIMKKTGIFETEKIEVVNEKGDTVLQDIEKEVLEQVKEYSTNSKDEKEIQRLAYNVNLVKQSLEQDTGIEHVIEVSE